MKIFKNIKELEELVVDESIIINDDITIDFHCTIYASIKARNIKAFDLKVHSIQGNDIEAQDLEVVYNIKARDVKAWDIKVEDIKARDINARDIKAWDIKVEDIKARDINAKSIKARNIYAENIYAENIYAENITYYAVCLAIFSFRCESVTSRRGKSIHFCLDGEIEYKKDFLTELKKKYATQEHAGVSVDYERIARIAEVFYEK